MWGPQRPLLVPGASRGSAQWPLEMLLRAWPVSSPLQRLSPLPSFAVPWFEPRPLETKRARLSPCSPGSLTVRSPCCLSSLSVAFPSADRTPDGRRPSRGCLMPPPESVRLPEASLRSSTRSGGRPSPERGPSPGWWWDGARGQPASGHNIYIFFIFFRPRQLASPARLSFDQVSNSIKSLGLVET